jgi:Flp pilus assembly protein TadB
MTVTVAGQAATPDQEGKVEGVKMGSEVKMTAKEGYKFRKVEVKKKSLLSIEIGGATTATIYYVEGDTWQQAIERPENEGRSWSVKSNYIFNGGYTLLIGSGYVSPGDTIDATKNYSLAAD